MIIAVKSCLYYMICLIDHNYCRDVKIHREMVKNKYKSVKIQNGEIKNDDIFSFTLTMKRHMQGSFCIEKILVPPKKF